MRVHILGTRGYPSSYGGFETLLRHLAPELVRRGHEVTVFDRDSTRTGRERMINGVRVYSSLGLSGTASSTLSHGLSSALVTAVERPDVALVMNVANGFFLPALRARRVPVALNVDGIEWERDKWSPTGKRVFLTAAKASARWADRLIADSHMIAARWRTDFGRESTFIPYGGDVDVVPQSERIRELGLDPGGYVLIVARLVPENNVVPMLEAAKLTGAPVVVVGSGPEGSELENRVRAEHDPPRVHALGHVSDQELLSALWAHCAVYLHGHSVGGTNPALCQAMGLGAPVLANDTGYNREVLQHPGMVVPLDPRVIAGRAVELLASPGRRVEAAAWGRRRVEEVYNWDAVCTGYEKVLTEIAR